MSKSTNSQLLKALHVCLLVALSVLIYQVAINARNDNSRNDPKLNLLVSQALVDYGTSALNAYQNDTIFDQTFQWYVNMDDIIEVDGNYFHYFPIGPSLLAAPFVAVARQFDMDMRTEDNATLQRVLAAYSCVIVFLLLVGIGRMYTTPLAATIISFTAVTGSTLISTLATGLWSLNFTAILLAAALLIVVQNEERPLSAESSKLDQFAESASSLLLGALLFMAFINRASAVALIIPLALYMLWRNWRYAVPALFTAAGLLAIFLVWSNEGLGSWLPIYYSTARLSVERIPIWIGLYGNLLSPSRGIFVFSPFWLLILPGLIIFWSRIKRQPLVFVCLIWFVLHLVLVSRAAKWWGGWSYGPRLLTDVALALVILTFVLWRAFTERIAENKRGTSLAKWLLVAAFLALSGVGIYINSYQGLYNKATPRWYSYISPTPAIHTRNSLGDMFRWDYAQWLADDRRVCQIEADKSKTYLDAQLPLGQLETDTWMSFENRDTLDYKAVLRSDFGEPRPFFVGWANADRDWRWSICPQARIIFDLADLETESTQYDLGIKLYAIVPQRVEVLLNGTELVNADWDRETADNGEVHLTIDSSLLKPGQRNEITFNFPEVDFPSEIDRRLLGIGFAGMKLAAIETLE